MVEIVVTSAFSVTAAQAFAFITDPGQWPKFFPGFVRFAQPGPACWQARGDRVTLVARVAGVRRPLHMTLEEHVPGQRVRFSMSQRGLPAIEHERIFLESGPGTCRICFIARYRPRAGALAIVDRVLLGRALTRGFRSAAAAVRTRLEPRPARAA